MSLSINASFPQRFYDHARLAVQPQVVIKDQDYQHQPNIIEKAGNTILWVLDSAPRGVKWIGRQFQDPRVVTVALTITALFLTTFAFYPTMTATAVRAAYSAVVLLVGKIPLWSVRLASYITTCAVIIGFGARAAGRFANAALMKAFYGLPKDHPGNPANMTINEIRQALQNKPTA